MAQRQNTAGVLEATGDGVVLRVKVVPGASRDRVAGLLGDRLKLAVSAPAEAGKANRAVCELVAALFDVPKRNIVLRDGHTRPQKAIEIVGLSLCQASERLQKIIGAS